jgi:type IV secretory pathway VirB9-like protein
MKNILDSKKITVLLSLSGFIALSAIAQTAGAQIRPPLGNPSAGGGNQGFGAAPVPNFNDPAQQFSAPSSGPSPLAARTEQDINSQASGQFPTMTRSSTLPVGALQKKWDSPIASTGQTAPGIMRFVWRPDFVMPIRTREFMTTTIELPAWENVERIILGDTMVFEATRVKQNILVVRPSHSGADTNMTIIGTSGNIYNFYVRSEGWNSSQITDFTVYVAAGSAAQNPLGGTMQGSPSSTDTGMAGSATPSNIITPPDYIRKIAFSPENLRFDLKIFAPTPEDIEIAPLRVFTDGIWTYFDYGDKADTVRRPVISRVVDGVDTMVNTRTAGPTGNIFIAEAIGNFTLRNGARVVCVYSSTPVGVTGNKITNDDDLYLFEDKPKGSIAPSLPSQIRSAPTNLGGGASVPTTSVPVQEPPVRR